MLDGFSMGDDGAARLGFKFPEIFREVSPRELAARNADAIRKDTLLRIAVGDRDGTFALNKEFHEHLETLKIPHEWTPLEGVEHDPMKMLEALGDRHWAFCRKAFGEPTARAPLAARKSA
jgi:hypothetical protein